MPAAGPRPVADADHDRSRVLAKNRSELARASSSPTASKPGVPPATLAATAGAVLTEKDSMRQLQQVPPQQQAFTRLNAAENYRRNFQSPPTPRVLSQFEVRRDGQPQDPMNYLPSR